MVANSGACGGGGEWGDLWWRILGLEVEYGIPGLEDGIRHHRRPRTVRNLCMLTDIANDRYPGIPDTVRIAVYISQHIVTGTLD